MKKRKGWILCCLFVTATAQAAMVHTAHDFFSAGASCHTAQEATVLIVNAQMQLSLVKDPHGYCLLSIRYQNMPLPPAPAKPAAPSKPQFAADTPYAMVEKSMTGSALSNTTNQPEQVGLEQITTPVTYTCPLSAVELQALTTPEALAVADQFIKDPYQKMDATTAALFSPVLNCIKQYTPPPLQTAPLPKGAVPFGALPVGTPLRLPSGQMVTPELPGHMQAPATVPVAPTSISPNSTTVSH